MQVDNPIRERRVWIVVSTHGERVSWLVAIHRTEDGSIKKVTA
jgi:hypothetical protein